jgi:uncharacterized integral membrane protein
MSAKKIGLGLIFLFTLIFLIQNTQAVEIRFLVWKISAVRAIVLAATFLAGMAAGFLMRWIWKSKRENSKLDLDLSHD